MQPPELYLINPPGLSREELDKLNAEADQNAARIPQLVQDGRDLRQHLSEGIRESRQIKKSVSRHLAERKR